MNYRSEKLRRSEITWTQVGSWSTFPCLNFVKMTSPCPSDSQSLIMTTTLKMTSLARRRPHYRTWWVTASPGLRWFWKLERRGEARSMWGSVRLRTLHQRKCPTPATRRKNHQIPHSIVSLWPLRPLPQHVTASLSRCILVTCSLRRCTDLTWETKWPPITSNSQIRHIINILKWTFCNPILQWATNITSLATSKLPWTINSLKWAINKLHHHSRTFLHYHSIPHSLHFLMIPRTQDLNQSGSIHE